MGIKAILGLIPIHLHLKKLYGRFHLRGALLLSNHIIKSIINTNRSNEHITHCLSLNNLIPKQRSHLNSSLIDMDNRYNKFLLLFSLFDKEFSLGKRLINSFSDCFSFHPWTQDVKNHFCNLDNITINMSSNSHSFIIISDASIRNNVATSISHIHSYDKPVIKTIHYMVNVTTTEAELFTIRCGINQAVGISNIKHIVVIMDSLHTAKRIFESSSYPYKIHSAAIFWELGKFLRKDNNNCIEFWDCSDNQNWLLHSLVDKDTKSLNFFPMFPCKSSWDFCKKTWLWFYYFTMEYVFPSIRSKRKKFS